MVSYRTMSASYLSLSKTGSNMSDLIWWYNFFGMSDVDKLNRGSTLICGGPRYSITHVPCHWVTGNLDENGRHNTCNTLYIPVFHKNAVVHMLHTSMDMTLLSTSAETPTDMYMPQQSNIRCTAQTCPYENSYNLMTCRKFQKRIFIS
jgi:hypothetical protein